MTDTGAGIEETLLVRPATASADGTLITVTPQSAGWRYVGFELLRLEGQITAVRDTDRREVCIVVIAGAVDISSAHAQWRAVGGRSDPFSGAPDAAYLPPQTTFELRASSASCEVGLCFAPGGRGCSARLLPAASVEPEIRGYGTHERVVHPILMGTGGADSLLVTEVQTPAGHWSSYPPHKHDRDALPAESYLEETYYHRVDPPRGFVLQRVYTDDRSLDQTLVVGDGDVVLVPRGYHPVCAPPGYRSYYLNVMAGPTRSWVFHNDPAHEWLLAAAPTPHVQPTPPAGA